MPGCVFCPSDSMITCYYDADHDGYGVPVPPIRACPSACVGDWTPFSGDCRYWDSASYPGAEEVCDGHDNDCDAGVDEGCSCSDGEVVVCHCGEVLGESHCGTDHLYDGSCDCSVCGDGVCFTIGVFQENCPADCGLPTCGDGVCGSDETLLTCSRDCGMCRFNWNLAGSADPPAACGSWWYIWDRVRCGGWIGLSAETPTTACLDALRARLALPPGVEGRIYGVDSAGHTLAVSIVDPASSGGPTWPSQLGWAYSF
ncbi:putative metal-binding motif-containing protein [Candidatus Falkowbacteria bacterium]|nr:putative metal-binding motif-containing protein [Candidatus Falkowbacteria bacterium]